MFGKNTVSTGSAQIAAANCRLSKLRRDSREQSLKAKWFRHTIICATHLGDISTLDLQENSGP
jgi:hypothetical protein